MEPDTEEEEEDIILDIPEGEALLQDSKMVVKADKSENCIQKVLPRSNFPTCIYFILGSEFCERFSYYGLRTILVIYLTKWLMFSDDDATILYHTFTMLCYFSPILGAVIADGYLGRFRTIMYLSVLYAVGNTVLALTALPPPEVYGPVIGLLLIGIGTGGIKPCVAAMGGDQFTSDQVQERLSFFSVFYFIINLGSMLSTIISPILRADVHCIEDSCYPLAFGVPALLMGIALVIFVAGRNKYKHVPLSGNVIGEVIRCIIYSIKKKCERNKTEKMKNHWLDYGEGKYEIEFIDDVKCVLKVLWLFLPLPVFWALFDQQGSRWTLQAEQMNGHLGSLARIKPDQLQVLNPILILVFIPIFQHLVYPALNRYKIPNSSLQKMVVGMIFGGLAFVIAGFVQIKLDTYKDTPLDNHESGVTFINTIDCNISYTSSIFNQSLQYKQISKFVRFPSKDVQIKSKCEKTGKSAEGSYPFDTSQPYILVTMTTNKDIIQIKQFKSNRQKPKEGKARISIVSNVPLPADNSHIELVRLDNKDRNRYNITQFIASNFTTIEPARYRLSLPGGIDLPGKYTIGTGGVYIIILTTNKLTTYKSQNIDVILYTSVDVNQMSMFYMIPQFIVITIGEVLFSITGLAFAYNEAPQSMKSVVQAAWLTTVACGNFIVVFVAEISILPSQTAEYFLFAVLMGLDIILFSIMSYFYKYSAPSLSLSSSYADTDMLVARESDEDIPLSDSNTNKSKYS